MEVTDKKEKSILNVGPRFTKGAAQAGGIVVLFENWVHFCASKTANFAVIDNNKNNYGNKFIAIASIIWQCWKHSKGKEVVIMHGTKNDYQWLAPIQVWIAKKRRCKVALRKFAGNFWEYYEKQKGIKRELINYALSNSDLLMWETHQQVGYFSKAFPTKKSIWFANVRDRMAYTRNPNIPFKRRFIYLSRIEKMKGIDYLLDAFDKLGPDYHIDIYGPLSGYTKSDFDIHNCCYKGAIDSFKVNEVLSNYDCLILPTCWRTEGYPGIIMEAYNAGVPVIASNVGGIPELIDNGVNGFLFEPESTQEIIDAVKKINNCSYCNLSKNAAISFEQYDAAIVNNNILSELMKL